MTWLSINPKSEPQSSVEVVADLKFKQPKDVTPVDMADIYNQIDPTVSQLEVTSEAKARFVDRWIQEKNGHPSP